MVAQIKMQILHQTKSKCKFLVNTFFTKIKKSDGDISLDAIIALLIGLLAMLTLALAAATALRADIKLDISISKIIETKNEEALLYAKYFNF